MLEGVAEANEAGTLARCVAVEHACEVAGLVCHDAYCLSVEAGEAYYEVLGVVALYFEELAVVDYSADYLVHVVRPVGRIGYDFVKRSLPDGRWGSLHSTSGASSRLFWGM